VKIGGKVMEKKCLLTRNMKLNIYSNESKGILNGVMGCNALPFMRTQEKVYPRRIFKLTIDVMDLTNNHWMRKTQLGT
jgi:hypothetical protein